SALRAGDPGRGHRGSCGRDHPLRAGHPRGPDPRPHRGRQDHPGDPAAAQPGGRAARGVGDPQLQRCEHVPDRVPAGRGLPGPVLLLDRRRGAHRGPSGGGGPALPAPAVPGGPLPGLLPPRGRRPPRHPRGLRRRGLRRRPRLGGAAVGDDHPVLTPGPSARTGVGSEATRTDSRTGRHPRPGRRPRRGCAMSIDGQPDHDTIPFDPGARDLGIVVGFDGSPNSTQALRYGAGIAARRGVQLTVITTYRAPVPVYGAYAAVPAQRDDEANRRRAQTALDEAAVLLEGHRGEVSYMTAEGDSVGTLADASANAQLVVVGARGRGGFLGLVRGSVASTLPAHARCPTIVVPGKDQSQRSRVAALHAAQVARERGTSLLVLMALPMPVSELSWYPELSPDAEGIAERRRQELQEVLEQDIAWIRAQVPAIEVAGE